MMFLCKKMCVLRALGPEQLGRFRLSSWLSGWLSDHGPEHFCWRAVASSEIAPSNGVGRRPP